MIHLRELSLRVDPEQLPKRYPFSLPLVRQLPRLELDHPVTFFVGENGSGKSTLMEALACAVALPTVGSQSVRTDPTLKAARELGQTLRLSWTKRTRTGFFLRAEDFFGYAKQLEQTRAEMEAELERVERDYADRSEFAKGLARMPFAGELHDMNRRFGEEGLDSRSHGEAFLALFQDRFRPNGLYLLDEPEAPLSPLRQMGFLSLLKSLVEQDAQFIIATHSPIILAYPDAAIYSFDTLPLAQVDYGELEHVTLTRDFLNNPTEFLRHL